MTPFGSCLELKHDKQSSTTTQVAVLGRTWHMFDIQVLVDTITAVNESHLPTQEEPQGLLAANI